MPCPNVISSFACAAFALGAAFLLIEPIGLLAGPPQQGKKLGAGDAEKILSKLFDAKDTDRTEMFAQLDAFEPLKTSDVKNWSKKLMTLAQKGPKLEEKGRSYLYDPKAKKGLYLSGGKSGSNSLFFGLHGGGVGQGDAESAKSPWNGAITGEGWLAIYPEVIEKTEAAWGDDITERFVLDLLEHAKRTYKLDTNKIFMGGHSMGGYGTWTLGGRHADLFAGLVAFAGAATPYRDRNNAKKIEGIVEGHLPNLRNIPIFVYHSKDDPRVDFETNEYAVQELGRLQKEHGGYSHKYDFVDGKGHDFPDPKPGLEFIHKSVRDPRPKKIVWQPLHKWKRMFYWIYWDDPIPASIVVAELKNKNEIDITVKVKDKIEEPKGFSVLLDDRLVDLEKEVTIRVNGAVKFNGKIPRSLATMALTAVERRDPEMLFTARVKL
ncbi:MAG: hypothetical protein ACKVS6_03020 [Planctomycetota bacterium]